MLPRLLRGRQTCTLGFFVVTCDLCTLDRYCEPYRDDMFACLAGVAARRGEVWAESVARRCGRTRPWPFTPTADAIARRKIADLTRDERLLGQLAREVQRYAARWWSRS